MCLSLCTWFFQECSLPGPQFTESVRLTGLASVCFPFLIAKITRTHSAKQLWLIWALGLALRSLGFLDNTLTNCTISSVLRYRPQQLLLKPVRVREGWCLPGFLFKKIPFNTQGSVSISYLSLQKGDRQALVILAARVREGPTHSWSGYGLGKCEGGGNNSRKHVKVRYVFMDI